MKNIIWVLVLAVIAMVGVGAVAKAPDAGDKAAKIAKALDGLKFSLSEAVKVAEKKTGGKAISCEVEVEKQGAVVEVMILKTDPAPELLEVEMDGATLKILEIEPDDDDDDEDEEEEEEEEDDD